MYTRWPVILVAALLTGCVSSRVQQGGTPGAARAANGIYLAPFVNATANPEAGSAVTEIATTSMMAHGLPVIQSESLRSRADELIGAGQQHQMMDVALASGASHALFGTVHEYRFKSDLDGAPTVGMTTRLVDIASGATVWQGTTSKSGYYYGSLSKTTQTAVNNLVEQMAGNGRIKASRRKKSNVNPYDSTHGGTYGDVNYSPPTANYSSPYASTDVSAQPAELAYQQAPPALPGYNAAANYQAPTVNHQTPTVNYQPPSPTYAASVDYPEPPEKRSWWSKTFRSKRGMPGTEPFRWTNRPRGDSGIEYEQIKRRGDSSVSPWPVAQTTPSPETDLSGYQYQYNAPTTGGVTSSQSFPSHSTITTPTITTSVARTDNVSAQWTASGVTATVPATTTTPTPVAPATTSSSLSSSGWTPSNY